MSLSRASRSSSSLLSSCHVHVLGFSMVGGNGKILKPCRKNRGPHRIRAPVKKELGRWSTDSALTRPHAASRLQFGCAPRRVLSQAAIGHILAAAYDRLRLRQTLQLGSRAEDAVEDFGEFVELGTSMEQFFRLLAATGGGKARDLPLRQ